MVFSFKKGRNLTEDNRDYGIIFKKEKKKEEKRKKRGTDVKQQEYDYLSGHYRIDKVSQTLWIQDRVGWRSFWREATKEEIGCFLVDFLPTVSSLIEQEERLNGLKIEPFCLLNISILERYKVSEAGLKEFYLAIGNGQFTFYFRCHTTDKARIQSCCGSGIGQQQQL